MAELDIELDNDLIERVKDVAVRHYGDGGNASITRVAEAALKMRLLWTTLVEGDGNVIDEPIVNWEFGDSQGVRQLTDEIRGMLFKRR